MASFADFLKEFEQELKALVSKTWSGFSGPALADGKDFIKESENDIKRWTTALNEKKLTIQDFEFLLGAQKDLAALKGLKQAGLAQIQLDRFMNGVVSALLHAATVVFV